MKGNKKGKGIKERKEKDLKQKAKDNRRGN